MPLHRHGIIATALLIGSSFALAGTVSIPTTFTANTPALASEVNGNFDAVATAINDSSGDIAVLTANVAALEAAVAALQDSVTTLSGDVVAQQGVIDAQQTTIDTQQATIDTLSSDLAAIQGSSLMALAAHLDILDVADPVSGTLYPTAQLTGINLQIVNGTGNQATANGLGNLIVGYNPTNPFAPDFCSSGLYASEVSCEASGGIWASNQRSGSHNLVVGTVNSYSQFGGVLAGRFNAINAPYASVTGGTNNLASGITSSVTGGTQNTASGGDASVSGGTGNTASGSRSSVSGGSSREAASSFNWAAGSLLESN